MKIATSVLAATALAGPDPIALEIGGLRSGCERLMKSSAFSGKQRPKLSDAKWQQKWSLKCQKQQARKEIAYKRCGEYVAGYSVPITKNVETETCEAISELASENIRWVDAHIVDTLCAGRVEKITKRMNNWERKLRSLINCPAAEAEETEEVEEPEETEETGGDPTLGYQTTVNEAFKSYDSYDDYYAEDHYLHDYFPNYFNAGDTITMSKRCVEDWNAPGNNYGCLASFGSQPAWDSKVVGYCLNEKEQILKWAVKDSVHPEQYITMLNCPQCGCTPGEYDAPEIDSDYRSHINIV